MMKQFQGASGSGGSGGGGAPGGSKGRKKQSRQCRHSSTKTGLTHVVCLRAGRDVTKSKECCYRGQNFIYT